MYYFIGPLALLENLKIAVVIFQYTQMWRILTNVYVINQSLIVGLAGLVLLLTRAFQFNHDQGLSGVWREIYCRVWVTKVPLWSLLISSTFNLLAVTLERYLGVVHPILHRVSFTTPKVVLSLVCVWLSGLVLQLSYKACANFFTVVIFFLCL